MPLSVDTCLCVQITEKHRDEDQEEEREGWRREKGRGEGEAQQALGEKRKKTAATLHPETPSGLTKDRYFRAGALRHAARAAGVREDAMKLLEEVRVRVGRQLAGDEAPRRARNHWTRSGNLVPNAVAEGVIGRMMRDGRAGWKAEILSLMGADPDVVLLATATHRHSKKWRGESSHDRNIMWEYRGSSTGWRTTWQ